MFQARTRQATGRLHVDVPSRIARLPGARAAGPPAPPSGCNWCWAPSDRAIDLVQEGVDCAVRVGLA
jgi:hypothetical protein